MTMVLEHPVLGQLAWHLGLASRYAVSEQRQLARTETLLAWALLAAADGANVDELTTFDTVVDLGESAAGDERFIDAFSDARDTAFALIGHFTNEQRFDLVDLYGHVLTVIDGVIERLRGTEATT